MGDGGATRLRGAPRSKADASPVECGVPFATRHPVTDSYTPAYQWNPQSELMPPVPSPKPAIESTT